MRFINTLTNYLKSSVEELKKVAWPTRSETVRYSALVIGISLALALTIGVLDFVFSAGLQSILRITGAGQPQIQQTQTQRVPIQIEDIQSGEINIGDIKVETSPAE